MFLCGQLVAQECTKNEAISFSCWSAQHLLAVVKLETHSQFDRTDTLVSSPHWFPTSRVWPLYQYWQNNPEPEKQPVQHNMYTLYKEQV